MPRYRKRFHGETISLVFPRYFDDEIIGPTTIFVRDGGGPFKWWERILIRLSFKFGRASGAEEQDPLTPAKILEHLADTVVGCIDRSAATSFRQTLGEMSRYHRFLIEIHMSEDSQGNPMDFAEFGDFASFETPHMQWTRQYRRLMEKASNKIDSEPEFMRTLSHLTSSLLPDDSSGISYGVIDTILSLAALEVVFLEKWFTRRTTGDLLDPKTFKPLYLATPDAKVYQEVVFEFVGAWETTGRRASRIYGWRETVRSPAADRWKHLAKSMPFMLQHLRYTAYLTASAVWNGDGIAAPRYQDMMVRWLPTVRPDIRDDAFTRHKWLLLPSTLPKTWDALAEWLSAHSSAVRIDAMEPAALFTSVLRHLYDDVVNMTVAVMLGWYMADPKTLDLAGETARKLLFGEVIKDGAVEPDGSRAPRNLFRSVLFTILRGEIGYGDGGYGTYLNQIVSFLTQPAEQLRVHSRPYVGFGWADRGEVTIPLLVIMVATLPPAGDDGVSDELDKVAANDKLLGNDIALRRIIQELNRLTDFLKESTQHKMIDFGAKRLSPTVDTEKNIERLLGIFAACATKIEGRREERMRTAPLDRTKLNDLREAFEQIMNSPLAWLPWLAEVVVELTDKPLAAETIQVVQINRGELTEPVVSQLSVFPGEYMVEAFRLGMAQFVWDATIKRKSTQIDAGPLGQKETWKLIQEQARIVGEKPVMLLSHQRASEIWSWVHEQEQVPDFIGALSRDNNHPTGSGFGYVANIDGIDVYSFNISDEMVGLFSAKALKSVSYRALDAVGHLVRPDVEDSPDPKQAWLTADMALELEWDTSPYIRILFGQRPTPSRSRKRRGS